MNYGETMNCCFCMLLRIKDHINSQKLNLTDASNNVAPTNSEVERLLKNTFETQQVKEGSKPRFVG